jgi:hypothetical protein
VVAQFSKYSAFVVEVRASDQIVCLINFNCKMRKREECKKGMVKHEKRSDGFQNRVKGDC